MPHASHPALAVALGLLVALVALAGCGNDPGAQSEQSSDDHAYVEYMAALTLAIEEGSSGSEAEARITELGVHPMSRDEIEEHAERLSRDPVRWSRLEEQVEERAEELRREERRSRAAGRR